MSLLEFAVLAVISITVIVNPASTSAVFIALTQKMKHAERLATAKRAVKLASSILFFFAITGMLVFELFGISIGAFKIAGGVLLLIMGMTMVYPKETAEEAKTTSKDIAVIPLAIPFSAGPGTITTVVVLMSDASTQGADFISAMPFIGVVFAGIAVAMTLSYTGMKYSEKINDLLKEGGRNVMTRLMGMLVLAIAIQFIIDGIISVVPDFMAAVDTVSG